MEVFLKGNRVTWLGDENENEGELKMIGEKTFAVQWDDGSYIEYPNDHQDAIKKIKNKKEMRKNAITSKKKTTPLYKQSNNQIRG